MYGGSGNEEKAEPPMVGMNGDGGSAMVTLWCWDSNEQDTTSGRGGGLKEERERSRVLIIEGEQA